MEETQQNQEVGNRYIDWAMGNRVIVLGHAYPGVNQAVRKQMEHGLNFTRPGILELELAEYLTDSCGGRHGEVRQERFGRHDARR